jgi:rod shape determining protein RodA
MGIDKVTIFIFLAMVVLGWLNIYAAVYNEDHKKILDLTQQYGKQFIWIIATIIVAIFVVIIDSRFYYFFGYFIYGGLLFLLLLVLILGKEINGARSWFQIGPLSLQPSEFAKIGTALALARYLNTSGQELTKLKNLVPAIIIILLPALLTALQPDMGSAVIYFSFFIVLFREGLSPYIFISGLLMVLLFFISLLFDNLYITLVLIELDFLMTWFASRNLKSCIKGLLIFIVITGSLYFLDYFFIKRLLPEVILLLGIILSGISYAWYIYRQKSITILVIYLFLLGSVIYINSVDYAFNNLLKPHQKERVNILLGFKSDPHGAGYNVNQSVISIGSGGLTGKGYLQGTQTKFKFVPAQSTDFIFCTVGEEWGFVGSVVVIGLYVFLLIRLVLIAERQRSAFSRISI